MKYLFSILTSTLLTLSAAAQTHTVSGGIFEKGSNLPLEFATVSFVNTETGQTAAGTITDMDGNYSLRIPQGVYDVRYEYISYETLTRRGQSIDNSTELPPVYLEVDSESLDEVEVRAETTEVQVRLDKKIYNIGKDLTTRGATVGDALSNVPSVDVSVEGAISLRGNENVRILINGRPSAIAGFGDTDALTQLPAEAIERVEVITSPSARYDAEGTAGILNIILKKDQTLGFNGSLQLNAGDPMNYGLTANMNLRREKFNIFNTTGLFHRKQPGNAYFDNRFLDADPDEGSFSRTIEDREYDRDRKGFNTNLGIEYYLTENSSITASGFMRLSDYDDQTTATTRKFLDGNHSETSLRRQTETEDDRRYQGSLNYINRFDKNGHELTADFQYEYHTETENTFITEHNTFGATMDYPSEDITTTLDRNRILAQADYVRPIGEHAQFEAGYRGDFENRVTDFTLFAEDMDTGEFVLNDLLTNSFDFTQNVQALYSQYGNKFGQFSFLLGLRLEQTVLKGQIDSEYNDADLSDIYGVGIETNFNKDYLGLFPTVNFIYELNERENVTLGYNRRINRPRSWFMNPFPSRASVTNVFQGNPDLDPAFAHAFDLGYLKRWDKFTLTSSVYYQHETNAFERVQQRTGQTVNGIEVVRTIPINLATNKRIGAEMGFLYNPVKWLRTNGSFNFFQFDSEGQYEGIDFGAKNTSWFARFSSKVSLPAKIDWQTNFFYRGPTQNAQTKNEGIFSLNLAISKELLNDNATVSLNVSDLLNSRKRRSFTETLDFTSDSEFQWRVRQITLSFIYRFNQQKFERERSRRRNGSGGGEDFEGDFPGR